AQTSTATSTGPKNALCSWNRSGKAGTTPLRSCLSGRRYPGRRGRTAHWVSADAVQAWFGILDRLEADIALAVSGGEPEAWNPLTDASCLPMVEVKHGVLDARARLYLFILFAKARRSVRISYYCCPTNRPTRALIAPAHHRQQYRQRRHCELTR